MAHLLLIDDEPALIPKQVRQAFPAPLHRVDVARSGADGIDRVRAEPPDVILLDLRLPDMSGLNVYQSIREIDARIPVIFVTVARSADAAIEAMQQGAFDYLFKPIDLGQLQTVVERGAGGRPADARTGRGGRDAPRPRRGWRHHRHVSGDAGGVQGDRPGGRAERPRADHRRERHGQGAGRPGDLPAQSCGPAQPFLALNCAAIPETLLESELFGHEKGAFTGADRRRIGKFEQCNGGTLFLDEIGDMPLALQAKVLRLLQDQVFERLGGNETVRTDVRLIAATHRDLKGWSAEGRFRPDLFYRLGVFTIHLPALRERGDDLPLLVRHFVRRFSVELGRDVREIAQETMDRLCDYSWPGNIRELQSTLKQALLQTVGSVLLPAFLPPDLLPGHDERQRRKAPCAPPGDHLVRHGARGDPAVPVPDRGQPATDRGPAGDQHAHAAAEDPRIPAGRSLEAVYPHRRRDRPPVLTTRPRSPRPSPRPIERAPPIRHRPAT